MAAEELGEIKMSFWLALSLLIQAGEVSEDAVRDYLRKCEAGKTAAIAEKESELNNLSGEKLRQAKAALAIIKKSPAPRLFLHFPPRKGDLGVFATAQEIPGGKSLTVLEVVDGSNAIVRAWHMPPRISGQQAEETTFVDVWIQGIDTRTLNAHSATELPHVFYVAGNKLIDTTCGKRSFPLLKPVDLEKYRRPR